MAVLRGVFSITIEVADAAAARDRVGAAGHPIMVELQDEEWGQRHFMMEDPTGLLVDVVEQIGPSLDDLGR
ncbi:MAG TPA: VOC family protein [Dermatophilaceae bacterium]|nr:VOC family protein [Dermatophilaceae bacterium]